jgi:hypothetical protein
LADKGVVEAGKSVDILHHAGWRMDDSEVVTKQFLSPTADDVDRAVIIENFFDGAAIKDPIEECAPEILFVFQDCPAAASGFTDKGVKVVLLLCAFPRVKPDRPEPSATEGEVKVTDAVGG